MPVLKNPKHEIFVQHVIAGASAAGAYKLSGFSGKDPRKRASDLRTKPEIKARIEELTVRITNNAVKRATAKLAIDKEWVLRELMDNLERGKMVKGGSSVVNRSCELIAKLMGYFPDCEQKKPLSVDDLTIEEIEQMLADAAKEMVQ
jgi:hypothetical protein